MLETKAQKSKQGSKSNTKNKPNMDVLPNQIQNQLESCLYIKRLIGLAISNIAYLRALFPENCFVDRSFDDLHVKIIKDSDSKYPTLQKLSHWLQGSFDALEKKYLKTMVFGIYEDKENPDTLLESYEFGFTYLNDTTELTLNVNDSKPIVLKARKSALRVLRGLIYIAQTLNTLPEDVFMTMKLYYYDDITPEDYEPPYFRPAKNIEFYYEGEKTTIDLGRVNAFWHQTRVYVNASDFLLKEDEFEAIKNKNFNNTTVTNFDVTRDLTDDTLPIEEEDEKQREENVEIERRIEPEEIETPLNGDLTSEDTSTVQVTNAKEKPVPKQVICPCDMHDTNDKLVECKICGQDQHAVCFKLQDSNKTEHICYKCSLNCDKTKENGLHIDRSLWKLKEDEVKNICLLRRCLNEFLKSKKLNKSEIEKKFSAKQATSLLKRLVSEEHIRSVKKNVFEIVDANKSIEVYFSTLNKISDSQGSTIKDQSVPGPNESLYTELDIHQSQGLHEQQKLKNQQIDEAVSKTLTIKDTNKTSDGLKKFEKSKDEFKLKRTRKASEPSDRLVSDKKQRSK